MDERFRVSLKDKLSNETAFERTKTHKTLITTIKKRQVSFFAHIFRKERLKNLVSTGTLEGILDREQNHKK